MNIQINATHQTQIDESDAGLIDGWKLHPLKGRNGIFYVSARKRGVSALLHRLIMSAPDGLEVDHINGDTLDNRRSNLRLSTRAQNSRNRKIQSNNKTGWKGTYQVKSGRWWSTIWVNRKQVALGTFDTPREAAIAYDRAAIFYFGEFARLNFPPAREASISMGVY